MIKKYGSTLVVVLGIFAFRSSLADQYVIPSGSMEPTIQVGDHVLVDKSAYDLRVPFTDVTLLRTGEPRRGEVVVFRDPRNPSIRLIKRLIGLPGDRIRVMDGIVAVNGALLATSAGGVVGIEQKLRESSEPFRYLERAGGGNHLVQRLPGRAFRRAQEFLVPKNSYFFLGDNRDNSADSREWGFASRSALLGKALRVLYSVKWDGWQPSLRLDRSGALLEI